MKKIFAVVFGVFMFYAMTSYAQLDSVKAENFIKKVTTQGIEQIINANVSQEEKDKRFEKLFNEYLDLDFIGKFVLGRYWNTATATERTEFIDVYRQMNIKTWSKRFDEFKGKKFIFNGTSASNSKNQIFVNTTVPMKQGAPAKVVWRVKDTNGTLKVVDIIIENVSLAITARNEYTAYIKKSKNGIADLIEDLRQKSK
ncbi:MAG: ABC transporter substrate-binding protein [Alphaproteobacteria bacterium]|nr:ABC transporter substrate-binding protein [Alphaproteobacteria bacterium]